MIPIDRTDELMPRLKAVRLHEHHLAAALWQDGKLQLPEGQIPKTAYIRSVNWDPPYKGWFIVLWDDSFDRLPLGAMIPIIDLTWEFKP